MDNRLMKRSEWLCTGEHVAREFLHLAKVAIRRPDGFAAVEE